MKKQYPQDRKWMERQDEKVATKERKRQTATAGLFHDALFVHCFFAQLLLLCFSANETLVILHASVDRLMSAVTWWGHQECMFKDPCIQLSSLTTHSLTLFQVVHIKRQKSFWGVRLWLHMPLLTVLTFSSLLPLFLRTLRGRRNHRTPRVAKLRSNTLTRHQMRLFERQSYK